MTSPFVSCLVGARRAGLWPGVAAVCFFIAFPALRSFSLGCSAQRSRQQADHSPASCSAALRSSRSRLPLARLTGVVVSQLRKRRNKRPGDRGKTERQNMKKSNCSIQQQTRPHAPPRLHQRQRLAAGHRQRPHVQRHVPTLLQGGGRLETLDQLRPQQPAGCRSAGHARLRMDCRTAQTAPGLTLTGWRSNRPPAFFCFGWQRDWRERLAPVAETRRLSRSPPPLVSETRRDSACPSGAPSGAFFRRRSAALFGLAAFPRPFALRGRPVQTLRSAHGGQKLPSEPTRSSLRSTGSNQVRPRPAGAALILGLCQFVFRSFSARLSVSRPHQPAFAGGRDRRCPLKTTPAGRPASRAFWVKGERPKPNSRAKKRP